MRYHPLIHVTGIALFVLYFLSLFRYVLRLLMEDVSQYAFSQQELAAIEPHPKENGTEQIPRIIHQVYLGFDNRVMPTSWKKAQQTCIDLHPDYEYMLWTNVSSRALLANEYPWFLETWDNYRFPIQRADSIRYFILAHHGGIYIDLDNGCQRNLDPLLAYSVWMPTTKIHVGLTNHVMGTRKQGPYFQLLVNRLQTYDYNWVLPYMTIMNSAGPHFVSLVWEEYLKMRPRQEEVRILMQEEYAGNHWSFFTKEQGGTWNHWDTRAFKWAGDHIVFVSITCFLGICLSTACAWWIGWKVAVWLRTKGVTTTQTSVLPLWQKSD